MWCIIGGCSSLFSDMVHTVVVAIAVLTDGGVLGANVARQHTSTTYVGMQR